MKPIEISIINHGILEKATIKCDRKRNSLTFIMQCGHRADYTASDLYVCFGMLRAEFSEIEFLCKGAKLNVHPSRMSSQMSNGLAAYELTPGQPSEQEDLVRIFDYEDQNLTNNIEDQKNYYKNWIASLALNMPTSEDDPNGRPTGPTILNPNRR